MSGKFVSYQSLKGEWVTYTNFITMFPYENNKIIKVCSQMAILDRHDTNAEKQCNKLQLIKPKRKKLSASCTCLFA